MGVGNPVYKACAKRGKVGGQKNGVMYGDIVCTTCGTKNGSVKPFN